jgi:hypothetical protein
VSHSGVDAGTSDSIAVAASQRANGSRMRCHTKIENKDTQADDAHWNAIISESCEFIQQNTANA